MTTMSAAKARSGTDAILTSALVAFGLVVLGLLSGNFRPDTQVEFVKGALCISICCMPLLVTLVVSGLRREPFLKADPGSLAALAFLVFFGAGLFAYFGNGQVVGFLSLGRTPLSTVSFVLLGAAVITSLFCVGAKCPRCDYVEPDSVDPVTERRTFAFSQVLFFLAIVGAFGTVQSFGGLGAATNALLLHSRNEGVGQAGIWGATWVLFALPAAAALVLQTLKRRAPFWRSLPGYELLILLIIALGIYGARLVVALSVVAAWFMGYAARGRGPRVRTLLVVAISFALASGLVLEIRASAQSQARSQSLMEAFSYSILDVDLAGSAVRPVLIPEFRSVRRVVVALSTALPGSGRRADEISASRVDVVMVKAIGNDAQAQSSGLPPSLPGFLLIGFGIFGGSVVAFALGLGMGLINRRLFRWNSNLGLFFYGLWGAFVFNSFKGGDLALDLGSELKRWLYLMILYVAVCVLIPRAAKFSK